MFVCWFVYVCVCVFVFVCVCVCVCKFYSCYMATVVVIINGHGLGIDMCVMEANPIRVS